MGLKIAVLPTEYILTTDRSQLIVIQRETETGDPLIILLSITKTMELLDCALVGVSAVIRLNKVTIKLHYLYSLENRR